MCWLSANTLHHQLQHQSSRCDAGPLTSVISSMPQWIPVANHGLLVAILQHAHHTKRNRWLSEEAALPTSTTSGERLLNLHMHSSTQPCKHAPVNPHTTTHTQRLNELLAERATATSHQAGRHTHCMWHAGSLAILTYKMGMPGRKKTAANAFLNRAMSGCAHKNRSRSWLQGMVCGTCENKWITQYEDAGATPAV